MAYATVEEVEARGGTGDVAGALAYAEALVDARAGRSFNEAPPVFVTVDDVRGDTAVVSRPFTDVTEVRVNGVRVGPSMYEVTSYGIRFLWSPLRYHTGRGASVRVYATFTNEVSPLVSEATILLALDRLAGGTSGGSSGAFPELPANVTSFSVEGLSATLSGSVTDTRSSSTGNTTADRLIDLATGGGSLFA